MNFQEWLQELAKEANKDGYELKKHIPEKDLQALIKLHEQGLDPYASWLQLGPE